MAAPSLILIPPTPTNKFKGSFTPSPSSGTSASSLPEPVLDPPRSSCESAIVTIYSMYGDEGDRGSWAASATEFVDPNMKIPSKDIDLTLPDNYRNSFFLSRSYTASELASTDSPTTPRKATTRTLRPSVTLNGIPSGSSTRPATSFSPTSFNLNADDSARRASTGQNLRYSAVATAPSTQNGTAGEPQNKPIRSRPPSQVKDSSDTSHERPIPGPSGSSTTPPSSLLPFQRSSTPAQSLRSKGSSPASHISVSRSESEEPDSFHVRSTYAHLDMFGVKGDGYEDGVERTRARIGASRASQLNAEQALCDGTEKTRDLDPKELETLSSLDRYVFTQALSQIH
jgi:hypothetical protein